MQRKTKSRKKETVHTSSAIVNLVPLARFNDLSIKQIKRESKLTLFKSSGPGGQHKNKTLTAVRLKHTSGVTVVVQRGRSLGKNKEAAYVIMEAQLRSRAQERAKLKEHNFRRAQDNVVRRYDFKSQMIRDEKYGKSKHLKAVLGGDLGLLRR